MHHDNAIKDRHASNSKKTNKLLCVTHIKVTIKNVLIPIRSYKF
jgi:hypothetical protein